MELVNFLKDNIFTIILIIILLIGGYYIFVKIPRKIKSAFRRHANNITRAANIVRDAKTVINTLQEIEEEPTPKSIGGMTNVYLDNIKKDFNDFHNQDAEAAIRTLIIEFLNIRYGNQTDFQKSKVNKNILLNVPKEGRKTLSNIVINGIAIYGYDKTHDYATITYRCSYGYNVDGKRKEERCSIDYTLQLSDYGDGQNAMLCENCGGTLGTNDKHECPWCGAKIIMDTIMNWNFTEITSC